MLNHFDELIKELAKLGLTKQDVMIIGSGSITVCGGRDNNDIEFCVKKDVYKKLPFLLRVKLFFLDHERISENVDIFRHRYLRLGLRDGVIFDKSLFNYYSGFMIVKPEIEYVYKLKRKWPKDFTDIQFIEHNIKDKFEWSKIEQYNNIKIGTIIAVRLKIRTYSEIIKGWVKRLMVRK